MIEQIQYVVAVVIASIIAGYGIYWSRKEGFFDGFQEFKGLEIPVGLGLFTGMLLVALLEPSLIIGLGVTLAALAVSIKILETLLRIKSREKINYGEENNTSNLLANIYFADMETTNKHANKSFTRDDVEKNSRDEDDIRIILDITEDEAQR